MIPAKATPSVQRAYLSLPPVPCIDERSLQPMELGDNFIGKGSFGSCVRETFKQGCTIACCKITAILFCLRSTPANTHHTVLEFAQHNMQLSCHLYMSVVSQLLCDPFCMRKRKL
jgi:hypothetical protein